MNNNLIRTTILLDKDLVKLAKMKAASEELTLSRLITGLITAHLKNGGVKKLMGTIAESKVIIEKEGKPVKVKRFIRYPP